MRNENINEYIYLEWIKVRYYRLPFILCGLYNHTGIYKMGFSYSYIGFYLSMVILKFSSVYGFITFSKNAISSLVAPIMYISVP